MLLSNHSTRVGPCKYEKANSNCLHVHVRMCTLVGVVSFVGILCMGVDIMVMRSFTRNIDMRVGLRLRRYWQSKL